MSRERDAILEWAEQGRIPVPGVRRALEATHALPGAADWRRFLERLLLWLGVAMLAAGLAFFIAYNWNDLGRFARFALIEACLLVALALVGWKGLESAAGKASLLAAAIVVGVLLAFIGQTYQTGADTFELFAVWALAILPWAVLARLPTLWLLWLALANLAVTLYFRAFGGVFGMLFGPERQLWLLFALNTAALGLWELLARRVDWLRERWAIRALATASGALVTTLAIMQVIDFRHAAAWAVPVWTAWLAAAYAIYRHRVRDLFVLAGGALSVICVVTAFLARQLLEGQEFAGAFLLIGCAVIGMSAAAGFWLRRVAREMEVL